MPAILTLTMNPALDLACETGRLTPGRKARCTRPREVPGGGGINVALGAAALGSEVLAVYPSSGPRGGPVGQLLDRLLDQAGLPTRPVPVAEDLRQNLSIAETGAETAGQRGARADEARVFHLVFPGPSLDEAERRTCAEAVLADDPAPAWTVLSGSLPPGVPPDFYADLARRAAERGSRVLLDTSGAALAAAIEARPGLYLLKPNHRELKDLFGTTGRNPEDYVPPMQRLVADGVAERVAVTLGPRGAVLVGHARRVHLEPPQVEGPGSVGAGDSFMAALVHRLAQSAGGGTEPDPVDAVRHGVAAAAAAVEVRELRRFRPEDMAGLLPRIRVRDI